jgi:hypothetical protein
LRVDGVSSDLFVGIEIEFNEGREFRVIESLFFAAGEDAGDHVVVALFDHRLYLSEDVEIAAARLIGFD